MNIMGIEGTAHTASVGIVSEQCDILANVSDTISPESEGIHPRIAANHHAEKFPELIENAIKNSSLKLSDIDLIAFSMGPGLGPCLRTTATAARTIAIFRDKPIVGVNHCVAHLEIGRKVCKVDDPILLYVSGGNTQLITYSENRYRILGETLDIGIGNFLDKLGRLLNLKFPAGPKIEKLAAEGKNLLDAPYTVKGMDVAFSGLLTYLQHELNNGASIHDVCYTAQEISFSMLTEITERALTFTKKKDLLIGGGVARNKRIINMLEKMVNIHDGRLYVPPDELCSDNGAMIAWTGYLVYSSSGPDDVNNITVDQKYRTDMVNVTWRNSITDH